MFRQTTCRSIFSVLAVILATDVALSADRTGSFYHTIAIAEDNTVHRTTSKNPGDAKLTWVIIKDGNVVLKRSADKEDAYRYFRQEPGVYTVYVEKFIDGAYRAVSNIVSYRIENDKPNHDRRRNVPEKNAACQLYLGHDNTVCRSLVADETEAELTWVVSRNGDQVLAANAKNSTQLRYSNRKEGRYQVSLHRTIDGKRVAIGNVVTYEMP